MLYVDNYNRFLSDQLVSAGRNGIVSYHKYETVVFDSVNLHCATVTHKLKIKCVCANTLACTGNFSLFSRIKTTYVVQRERSNKISLTMFLNKLSFSLRTSTQFWNVQAKFILKNTTQLIVYEYVRRPCWENKKFLHVYIASFYVAIKRNKTITSPKTVLR